tara:strand:- start:1766 stop:2872 length:1107 start_codon:yes stop_codon:yes gene_type:complete
VADTDGGQFIDGIRYGPQRSGAWHGEHETYGTEQQFIEGEKLQDLMPQDTSWGMRPTYANPVAEFIGENPVANLAVDAQGILRRGGGPTGLDWAMLGLSGLPMVAPYAKPVASAIGTAGTAIKRSIQEARFPWMRDPLYSKKSGKFEELPIAPSQVERRLDEIFSDPEKSEEFATKVFDWLNDTKTDFELAPSYGTGLPKNVTQLPGTKDIREMTWREWDNLSDSAFQLSSKQHGMMRAQGIADPDDVLDHFWGRGARDDFVGWLEEAIAKTGDDFKEELEFVRLRDLKSGYVEEMTTDQLSKDVAWKHLGDEFDEMFRGTTEPLAVAQKMSWRPDNVSHEHWAQFTKDMTMKEVENAYRRYTLKLID